MLGAIYTALSGMTAYSDGLQTISNNVANLNTDGFKEQNVAFAELVNTGQGTYAGEDSQAGGYGVMLEPSTTDFSQGTLQQTSSGLDLAIQGAGFLAVENSGSIYYLRSGSFSANASGYLTDQNGDRLTILNAENQPEALNISALETDAPAATTDITFDNNVSSSGTTATVSNVTVYDAAGGAHTWIVALSNPTANTAGTGTDWTVTVTDSTGATVGTGTIGFIAGSADPSNDTITMTQSVTGAADLSVKLDFSAVTSYSAGTTSTLATNAIDGNALGTMTGVSVDTNGIVQIAYSNGKTQAAGTVAIANFRDLQQLQLVKNGLYRNPSIDPVQYYGDGAAGIGTLQSSELEQSNVNLSNEFGDLILIERGYQACSEVLSISNNMIQTLFGIQGQGVA